MWFAYTDKKRAISKRSDKMSEIPKAIPNKVVDLLVSEVFRKNNVNLGSAKSNLSDEQKQADRKSVV